MKTQSNNKDEHTTIQMEDVKFSPNSKPKKDYKLKNE